MPKGASAIYSSFNYVALIISWRMCVYSLTPRVRRTSRLPWHSGDAMRSVHKSWHRDTKLVQRVIGPGFPTIKSNVNRYLYCAIALFMRRVCKHFEIDSCRKDPCYSLSSGLPNITKTFLSREKRKGERRDNWALSLVSSLPLFSRVAPINSILPFSRCSLHFLISLIEYFFFLHCHLIVPF